MEIKTGEIVALETGIRKKKQTAKSILLYIILFYAIAVTLIFSYGLYESEKLHNICSDVKCLDSTSTSITVDEYNDLVDRIDSVGYDLSYIVKNKYYAVVSEQSGKIDRSIPLDDGYKIILTCTHKADSYITDIITVKEYVAVAIEYKAK